MRRAPGTRYRHAMTYDVARDRIVMFSSNGIGVGELWEWDGSTWMQRAQTGAVPGSRDTAQLVYDRRRHEGTHAEQRIDDRPDLLALRVTPGQTDCD